MSISLKNVVRGVDHLTLPVGDLALAERFYVDLLGATVIGRFDEAAAFRERRPERAGELKNEGNSPLHLSLRFGKGFGPRVDLFLQGDGQPAPERGHPHLALAVKGEDMDRARDVLAAADVPFDGPRRLGPPGQASLYFLDPFGNKLEFVTDAYAGEAPVGAPDLRKLARDPRDG
ncbi:VOC family protein [Pendulispora brunnea]|uniref:VOC family protein n=1 Tax=Pendulispora brunnea TaxID=2905690 RepID=A0ABZ2KSE7_9BACT